MYMVAVILSTKTQEVETLGVAIVSRNTTLLKQVINEVGNKSEAEIQAIWRKVEADLEPEEVQWFHEQLSEVAPGIIEPLTFEEQNLKQQIEVRLYNFFASFVERGRDLYLLNAQKLYREEYPSWDIYCKCKLGITRQQAYRLIKAYQVVEQLTPNVTLLPSTETIAREVGKSQKPEERLVIWQEAIRISEQTNRPISADIIKRIRLELIPEKEPIQLPLQIGELIIVDCQDSHLDKCWGRIFNITKSGRYKVQVGLELITLKANEVILPEEIDNDFCERVESLITTRFDSQVRQVAATFYRTHQPQDWQVKLLNCLEEVCQ
jgi:hypothetical protein